MKNKLKFIIPAIIVLLTIILIPTYLMNKSNLATITTNEFRELIDNADEKIVYIGRPTCPGCEVILPEIEAIAETVKEEIYYYNTDKAKKKDFEDFEAFKKEINLEFVPTIIRYEGSKEVERYEYKEYAEDKETLEKFIKGSN